MAERRGLSEGWNFSGAYQGLAILEKTVINSPAQHHNLKKTRRTQTRPLSRFT